MFLQLRNLFERIQTSRGATPPQMTTKATGAVQEVSSAAAKDAASAASHNTASEFIAKSNMWKPDKFTKKILVWTGKYKAVEDVPTSVPMDVIEKAKNRFRIKVANYSIVATLVGCFFLAILGKKASERGETVAKMNLDWHKEINKESATETK